MLKMFYYICLAMFPAILLFLEQYCYVKVSWYDKDIDKGISQLSIFSLPIDQTIPCQELTHEIQVKKYGSMFTTTCYREHASKCTF